MRIARLNSRDLKKRLRHDMRFCYHDRCGAVLAEMQDGPSDQHQSARVKKTLPALPSASLLLAMGHFDR
jgi:hypothetical protein